MKQVKKRIPVERKCASEYKGLTSAEVAVREKNGYTNKVTDKEFKSAWSIIFKNVFTFFNSIFLFIALIFLAFIIFLHAYGRDDVINDYFGFSKFMFLIPVIMNIIMGTSQELHSRKVIQKLKIVTEAKCTVVRDGRRERVDSSAVVIDDIIVLNPGEQALADLEVISGEVAVDESMLTGESDYIKKHKGDTILSGSSVMIGDAFARVIEVGDETYAAKLSEKVKKAGRHKSELMETIIKIIKFLTVLLVVVTVTVITTLVIKIASTGGNLDIWINEKEPLSLSDPVTWARIMVTTGSFGVGLIPTGLVLTTSVTLLLSIVSLSKKKTLIQELYSLENLSRVDVICLDKTGTLTDGTMNVSGIKEYAEYGVIEKCIKDLLASTKSRNQTAEALYQRFGSSDTADFAEVIPFSSETKCSGIVYRDGRKILLGAPEYLLKEDDERLGYVAEQAAEGKRVIAMTQNGELLCFFLIVDRIRSTARDTLEYFKNNGVTVKIISGDNPLTVSKIASMCGVENSDKYISLEGMPLEKIPDIAEEYTIFARVSPEQKEALVGALQSNGHKVAMTGDGVNDILALRKADSSITIAKATEAAKSCSDVVLLDNEFSHMKDVVGEGRRVISNVQRTSILFLMKSVAIAAIAFILIPFGKGQMWYSVESAYLLESTVIGTGGFLLSLESKKTPVRGAFMKSIIYRAAVSGILVALAACMPIMMYVIPAYLGLTPLVDAANVPAMMTVLMSTAGLVVMFAMCIPFNRYRIFAMGAVLFVALFLSMALPTSFLSGNPTGAPMFAFDKAAGQTIFDSQFFKELFQPWNSVKVQGLFSNSSHYAIFKIFLLAATPAFLVAMRYIDHRLEHPEVLLSARENALKDFGRVMLLISGLALIVQGVLPVLEFLFVILFSKTSTVDVSYVTTFFVSTVIDFTLNLFMGYTGYKAWKTGERKYIIRAFVLASIMLTLLVAQFAMDGVGVVIGNDVLETVNNGINLIITGIYIAGGLIITIAYFMKKRAKKKKSA